MRLKSIKLFSVFLLLIFFASSSFAESDKVKNFKLKGVDNKTYSLSDYAGKVVLINFWSMGCAPCLEELPSLARLSEKMKGKDFVVLGISEDQSESALKDFLQKKPLPYPVLKDLDKRVAIDNFAIFALPGTVILDRKGRMIEKIYGPRDWDKSPEFDKLEALLKK